MEVYSNKSKKRVRDVDRISSLPDFLLCEILSYLPTKQVVATGILSNRWRSLWTLVPSLGINSFDVPVEGFAMIVNRVLSQTESLLSLDSFRVWFCCRNISIDSSYVSSWICIAGKRGIKKIHLLLDTSVSDQLGKPVELHTCETIVVLNLRLYRYLKIPLCVHFPSLKKLFLNVMLEENAFQILLSGCPVLEDLFIKTQRLLLLKWNICPMTLKNLTIESHDGQLMEVDINVSSVQNFTLIGYIYDGQKYYIRNLDKLVEAKLDVYVRQYDIDILARLLGDLGHVKILSLVSQTLESLHHASNVALPDFHNLCHLEVAPFNCDMLWVMNLLQKCHKLEVLVIDMPYTSTYSKQPSTVPNGLSSHLIICKIKEYNGSESQLGFAKYILNNARVLKTMLIHTTTHLKPEKKRGIIKELSRLPRASTTCRLEVDHQH